jgi:uncharacterized membrane protein YeaQ/YmgE (transglycosylase-associated protein family)
MTILAWIAVGIVAGYLAKRVMLGEGAGGVLRDLVVGVIGALVGGLIGGWIYNYLNPLAITGGNIYSVVVASLSAVLFLWTMRLVNRSQARI